MEEVAEVIKMVRPVPALINPKILSWARESAGISIDIAAGELNIPREKLESAEHETGQITVAQLRKIANYYKRPQAAFYLHNVPEDQSIPDFRTFTPEERPLTPKAKLEIRKLTEKRKYALELLELLHYPVENSFENLFSEQDNFEVAAQKLRSYLDVTTSQVRRSRDPYTVFNFWRSCVENANILVFQFGGVDVDLFRGFALSERPLPAIGINQQDAPQARVFTLIHEICHIILKQTGTCDVAFDREIGLDSVETFCNYIAGATLVPAEELIAEVTRSHYEFVNLNAIQDAIKKLASYFRVSKDVIARRLLITLCITTEQYRSIFAAFQEENRGNVPPAQGGGNYYTLYFSKTSPMPLWKLMRKSKQNLLASSINIPDGLTPILLKIWWIRMSSRSPLFTRA
ncbi:MAG TPA: ImmA/IrrE family metallo-endopeptidase, partial [Candidatus Lokiarchaeia archaeon]|nr:ImmA/IrrE family metallo-endopeptidase [Candidatus Lokiarchaeia archaeon]